MLWGRSKSPLCTKGRLAWAQQIGSKHFAAICRSKTAAQYRQDVNPSRRRLNTDFWNTTSETSHSLYVGSYGRNTATQGFSDLDMIIQLPHSVYKQYDERSGNGQSALLQAVKNSIAKTYSTSQVGANGQIVEISFKDGITFEVVPAFENSDKSFTFPDSNNGAELAYDESSTRD